MAFDYGSAGGGAITGAQAGTSIAPGIGTAIGAVAGGLLGGFGGGKKATAPTMQWLQNPQYANVQNTMDTTWGYLQGGLQNLQEGRAPTWFQNWRPLEEYQRKNALTGAYYGKGAGAQGGNMWGPGILQQQQAADIAAGRRGAGAGSNYAKQLQMYSQGMSDIDRYLSQLGYQSMNDTESRYLQSIQGMPTGPEGQWSAVGGSPAQQGWGSQILNAVGTLNATQGGFGKAMGWGMGGSVQPTGQSMAGSFGNTPYGQTANYQNMLYNTGTGQNYGGYSW